jgi:hypothetical protein
MVPRASVQQARLPTSGCSQAAVFVTRSQAAWRQHLGHGCQIHDPAVPCYPLLLPIPTAACTLIHHLAGGFLSCAALLSCFLCLSALLLPAAPLLMAVAPLLMAAVVSRVVRLIAQPAHLDVSGAGITAIIAFLSV